MDKTTFTNYLQEELYKLVEVNKKASIEYTNNDDAFDNFKRIGATLGIDPKVVLMVYLVKHIDGITKYCKGNKSLREPIQGRIEDAQLYLGLLKGMIYEESEEYLARQRVEARTGVIDKPLGVRIMEHETRNV